MTRARDVANLIGSGNYSSTTFTATAGQTVFSIAHTQNFVQVFMNGLLLDLTADYTSNGSAVTLTSGAAAGDEIEVVAYNTFSVGDALNQAAADTRYVNTTGGNITGDLTVDTDTLKVDSSNDIVLINTTASGRAAEGADQLTIEAADNGHSGLTIRSGSSSYGTINFSDSAGGVGEYQASIFMLHGTDTLTLATAGSDRVKIDSAGRVTKPSTPHFFGRGYSANVSGTDRATFSSIVRNNGSHWNNSTGNFTCPVAGTYHVTAFSGYKAADGYLGMGVGYNGSILQYGWSSTNTNHQHATQCCTVVYDASANDTFYYYVNPGGSYVKPHSSVGYSGMSVYLLG